jgi:hypothetical protein
MAVVRDEKFASEVGPFFGEYVGTLTSANAQVRADIFKEEETLVAHVSFATGFTSGSVTDPYLGEIKRFAAEKGFAEHLRLVLSGG